MDLEALRAFVELGRTRSFTAAAGALGTTQPSLSRRIQHLEREVGSRLVVRSARGASLTPAGERFVVHAERALRAIEVGVSEVDELTEAPHGAVAIGTMPTVSTHFLPAVVARFAAQHPAVLVKIREGFPHELEDLLARGALDLAVMNLPVRRGDLSARKLWQEEYWLVVPEAHRLAGAKRVDLVEVAGEPLVVIPGVPATHALEAACEERGVPPRIVVEADTLESVRRLVERGIGIALLPRILAAASDLRGVRAIEVGRGGLKRQVALVHRGEAYLTAAARALRSLVVEAAKGPSRAATHAR